MEKPEFEIIFLESENVIVTSGETDIEEDADIDEDE